MGNKSILMNFTVKPKPFVKWAGGKTQLIEELGKRLPQGINSGEVETYIEPFVGSGALLFHVLYHYPLIKKFVIIDNNCKLINVYKNIKNDVDMIIEILRDYEKRYLLANEENRKKIYYQAREEFNNESIDSIKQSALFIFLNKTCYNGLYRENQKGEFNVPIGRYKKPLICDEENLRVVHKYLQKVDILCGDFEEAENHIEGKTFVYFDPPYKPISSTANFTSYIKDNFDDNDQLRLFNLFERLDKKGVYLMMSNSDPLNNSNDDFFDRLYKDYFIERVEAARFINSKSANRGKIKEIIIRNYRGV